MFLCEIAIHRKLLLGYHQRIELLPHLVRNHSDTVLLYKSFRLLLKIILRLYIECNNRCCRLQNSEASATFFQGKNFRVALRRRRRWRRRFAAYRVSAFGCKTTNFPRGTRPGSKWLSFDDGYYHDALFPAAVSTFHPHCGAARKTYACRPVRVHARVGHCVHGMYTTGT